MGSYLVEGDMNLPTLKERFEAKFIRGSNEECWLWTATTTDGYGSISYKSTMLRAHRLSYELYVGQIPKGLMVLHKCDVRACVNPHHFFLGTHLDNARDRVAKGRSRSGGSLGITVGEANGCSKLKDYQIVEIRQRYVRGYHGNSVALRAEYGVSRAQFCQIVNRKAWKHIK